jgi:microcystin-dependent protein
VRDANGELIENATVGIQISILQGSESGFPVYMESFTPLTNDFGLISLEIGSGTLVGGDFENINWGDGPYFIKTEVDPAGGSDYSDLGSTPLVSVPYALHASKADTANYADSADYAEIAGNAFDGDYASLTNTPDWNDTLDMRLDSAMFLSGEAASGNLVTYDGMNWIARDIRLAATGNSQPLSNIQPYLAVNYCIATQGLYPSRNWEPFLGTIGIFGFNFAPRGWAQCSGQLLPIAQNTALFSLLGTIYGGDGRTTFALPDLRGRVPVNYGQGAGLSSYQIGQRGGVEQITLGIQNLPSHSHTIIFE